MRRIKLGKGLLKSLFPSSKKKKKSSAKKNKSPSSTEASGASTNQTNCPPILGGGRRKKEQRPYELHQEGASSPPSSDDEGRDRDINNVKNNVVDNNGGVDEQLQPTPTPQQKQQEDGCIERVKDTIRPTTVTCSTSEESEVADIVKAVEKVVVEVNENEEEHHHHQQQHQGIIAPNVPEVQEDEQCEIASFDHHQFTVTSPLTSPLTSPQSSPSRDEARRKATARQQRILAQASTRFQALSETATIDTSGFSYTSPPHLQRRRWQQHIGRQRPPLPVPAIVGQDVDEKPKVPSPQGLAGLPRKQLLPPSNATNCTSVVFYDATPAKNLTVDVTQKKNEEGGKHISPTCVADLENIEVASPKSPTALTRSSNSSYSTSTTTGKNNIHFFILLLCPHSRIFEVVEIWDAPLEATIGDVLNLIPRHITDGRLLKKKYIGLCRPADRVEFIDLTVPAFLMRNDNLAEDSAPFDFIHESDVLVAILKGSTCYQMSKISKPILKNPKFKEMIRRRRRQSEADKAAARKKRKSKKRQTDKLQSPTKAIYISDESSVVSGITTFARQMNGKDDPTSLSKMLETLSQKLHEVEEDGAILPCCDDSSVGSSGKRSVVSDLDQVKRKTTISDVSVQDVQRAGFKMSPKMLAMELAQTIEDIFANQNVEIVAVDADDNDDEDSILGNDDDSDADTFVSARSHRSKSTLGTLKSVPRMPRVVTKSKPSPRQFKFTETMEDNALAAQIEAMAAQADAAFEDRSKKNSSRKAAQTEKNSSRKAPQAVPVVDQTETKKELSITEPTTPALEDADIDSDARSFQSTFDDALSHIESEDVQSVANDDECKDRSEEKAIVTSTTNKDVTNRKFLSASTSTVSKMVADNEGRVNEMHVLESLGCTIVCIAANYMQKARHSGKPSPIESKDVFQSATFLAFMVSGQKYLAKVTEK